VPGDVTRQLNRHAVEVFVQYGSSQHTGSNILDMILMQEGETHDQQVTDVAVQSDCFSEHHHLLTHRLGVLQPPPVTKTYRIDRDARRLASMETK